MRPHEAVHAAACTHLHADQAASVRGILREPTIGDGLWPIGPSVLVRVAPVEVGPVAMQAVDLGARAKVFMTEEAEQMVERAVLQHHDHDRVDLASQELQIHASPSLWALEIDVQAELARCTGAV